MVTGLTKAWAAAVLFAAVLAGGPAQALGFAADEDGIVRFVTPTGSFGCAYIPFDGAGGIETGVNGPELHCYRLAGKFAGVSLGPSGKALRLVVRGALVCCGSDNVLAFGASWRTGGYVCQSERAGLACRRGKHGFKMTAGTVTRY